MMIKNKKVDVITEDILRKLMYEMNINNIDMQGMHGNYIHTIIDNFEYTIYLYYTYIKSYKRITTDTGKLYTDEHIFEYIYPHNEHQLSSYQGGWIGLHDIYQWNKICRFLLRFLRGNLVDKVDTELEKNEYKIWLCRQYLKTILFDNKEKL